ncbi:MAG: S41 family peptidase [Pirellulales bacterium]|nr:S41 family peptidase [Pirellulales bacterium]
MRRRLLSISSVVCSAVLLTSVWCGSASGEDFYPRSTGLGSQSFSSQSANSEISISKTAIPEPSRNGSVQVPQAAVSDKPASDRLAEIGDLLREGRRLEVEDRWGEALTHYEEAIRIFPDEDSLRRRFDFSRMHYDLRRRYSDTSFCGALNRLEFEQALDLYTQVLLKVQTHYVETPHWKELVERGTNSFDVALSEDSFISRHIPHIEREMIDDFRHELRRKLGPMVIGDYAGAREAVAVAAGMAHRRLGIRPTSVVLEYLCGATNSLDVYSAYLTPDQLAEVYSQIEGNFVGLGIELRMDNNELVIVRVISGSPAQKAGIRDGDRIVAVDGQPVADMSTDEAANLLQGKVDTIVRLDLAGHQGAVRSVSVRRERVEVPSVDQVRIVDSEKGIGYLRLTCFQKTTCKDLDDALWKLYRQGMRGGLIVDLRGNPGGLLVTSVEAVDRFVERGVIVSTRGRDVREGFTYSAHVPGTWRVPLAVMIDKDSASAAEIFAGAIRDHRRGTIVGHKSYGKGSVQGIFPLQGSQSGMRLTTAKFYSPNGRPYSLVGVKPDIQVQTVAKPIAESGTVATQYDPVLAAAVDALKGGSRKLAAQR